MTNKFTGKTGVEFEVGSKSLKASFNDTEVTIPLERNLRIARNLPFFKDEETAEKEFSFNAMISMVEAYADPEEFEKLLDLPETAAMEVVTTWIEHISRHMFVFLEDHQDPKES